MASTLDDKTAVDNESVVAIIDAREFEAAGNDPRVQAVHERADAYIAELERQRRNR